MRIRWLLFALLFIRCASAAPRAAEGECFMLQALDGSKPVVSDRAECNVKASPASTFKVPHALIALETGVVKDPFAMVAWDGTEQSYDAWERDHSLDSSMKWSVLWFYRRTAAAIGRERMLASLRKLGYGSDTYEGEQTSFWVNGELVISPAEQLAYLRRMFRYELPASRANIDAVKAAMRMPEDAVTMARGTHPFPVSGVVHAKTGNTTVAGERVSWLIGHLEREGKQYVFVARKRGKGSFPGTAGADLALRELKKLKR
jgi:beta-lactamase class D